MLPYWSVVVICGPLVLPALDVAPGAAADVMMWPPALTLTLAIGEVVVIDLPWALVVVMIAPATSEDVVIFEPCALVVVIGISTLAEAEATNASVLTAETLPSASVEESTTGTK